MTTEHLTDDALILLARTAPSGPDASAPGPDPHLATCGDCHGRMAQWQAIGAAVRSHAEERTVAPPSFDILLGAALDREQGRSAVAGTDPAAPADGFRGAWRTSWQLVARQVLLLPRSWAPLSAVLLLGAALLASAQEPGGFGLSVFGSVVVLLMMLGALMVVSPRRDPRSELLFTLPVPPATVFLARLTVVMGVDVALALACSTLVDDPAGWARVVSVWLGPSLLAASCALALAVRFSPAAGATAGGAVWLLGVVSGPQHVFATPLAAVLSPLLSTTVWTVLLAAVFLGWAVRVMRSFLPPAPQE
ncbi:anti-sigma factor family protein [Streptomyces bacillaris]|uniref:anti-sigma factor family protein n=1 Tax=Streptomyces bacillaris TaxID=68179 RepID=UPI0038300264